MLHTDLGTDNMDANQDALRDDDSNQSWILLSIRRCFVADHLRPHFIILNCHRLLGR